MWRNGPSHIGDGYRGNREGIQRQDVWDTPNFDPATQIRVLVVEVGEYDSPVIAHFQVCAVHGKRDIEWDAISYTWDGQTPSREIKLHGETIKVNDNVFRILRDLRHERQRRFLWIDAVCIDQENSDEKSKQVGLMRDIYLEARSVIIWLDTKDINDAASAVFSAAHWMEANSEELSQLGFLNLQENFKLSNPDVHWNGPFHRIAALKWFQRIWVVQEAALGANLQVSLGQMSLPWDLFVSTTIRFLSLLPTRKALRLSLEECYAVCRGKMFGQGTKLGLSMIYLIITLKTWLQESDIPISPSELVVLCKDRAATVPSDMIYGVSGFFKTKSAFSQAVAFPIDYRLSSGEVYKRFTIWCIEQERNLDILAQQRNENGFSSISSWTTDWNDQALKGFNLTETSSLMSRLHHHPPLHSNTVPSYQRVGDILVVRGFIVDDFGDDIFELGLTRYKPENRKRYQEWLSKIPDDEVTSDLLFGERRPTVETLERLYSETKENDPYVSHLWRDGSISDLAVREPNAEFRVPLVTRRGCLAMTFPYFNQDPSPKVCYLLGGRGLFVLKPVSSGISPDRAHYSLITGDCFIHGFEDGKGYEISKALGLDEQDICIV